MIDFPYGAATELHRAQVMHVQHTSNGTRDLRLATWSLGAENANMTYLGTVLQVWGMPANRAELEFGIFSHPGNIMEWWSIPSDVHPGYSELADPSVSNVQFT